MTKAKRLMSAMLALAAMSPLMACGDLADKNTSLDRLAVLRGTAFASSGAQSSDTPVSMTILWAPTTSEDAYDSTFDEATGTLTVNTEGWVQQAVTYQSSFPFDFEIGLSSPPPAEARQDLSEEGGGTFAYGTLVAFKDLNGNGVLDRGTPGVAGDEILGLSDRGEAFAGVPGVSKHFYRLFYLDGLFPHYEFPGLSFPDYPQGFSIATYDASPSELKLGSLPITSHVELDLSPLSVREQADAMFKGCSSVAFMSAQQSPSTPAPDGASIECVPSEPLCYSWSLDTIPGPCTLRVHAGQLCLPDGSTPPADWPCN